MTFRLRMKKFADMNEEELKHFSEDVDYAEIDQREEQQEDVENKDPNKEGVQRKEALPVRSITASKILRASLACEYCRKANTPTYESLMLLMYNESQRRA